MSLMHTNAFYRASFHSALFQWIITAIRLRGQAELCAVLVDPAAPYEEAPVKRMIVPTYS